MPFKRELLDQLREVLDVPELFPGRCTGRAMTDNPVEVVAKSGEALQAGEGGFDRLGVCRRL